MRWLFPLFFLTACQAQDLPPGYAPLEGGGVEAVRQVALGGEGYARMLAGWRLVDREEIPLAERAEYAWRYALFLEGARAFEPGWEAKAAWRVAAPLLERAQDPRAFAAWQRLLPQEEAVAALLRLGAGEPLWEALFRGQAYEALLRVLPQGARPDLRAQALYRLGRYQEALPHYRAWAERDPRGYLGLGYALWRLGRREEALWALGRYDRPESRYAQARIREEMGQKEEALSLYRRSTPEGLWQATALLERAGLAREALSLYLELAQSPTPFADDAALRAYLLAGELGLPGVREEAYALLSGGLGLLVGKTPDPPPPPPEAPSPPEAPRVEALLGAGQEAWARGEVRYALWQRPGDWPALVPLLYRLGAYREGIRAAWPTALAYPRAYGEWVEAYARREGLDPHLLYALLHVESRFDPKAVSPTGALGLGQFLRGTWADVARMLGEPPADPMDPEASIRYAARYLRWLLERCQALGLEGMERTACALTAYNGGIGYTSRGLAQEGGLWAFLRFQERDEPREYLAKVLSAYAAYRAIPWPGAGPAPSRR
ncbi:MAG: transglycosylase SLT domain-containing protein [Thermus sp.]|uniref:transglycosylase SLT domain-containing protein n=1 Tax=Thermus sp. TaxID=275 RepID=UPI0025D8F36E|nr:transglycosylase SLT domain-containing protein [Thermus sp.]MCS6867149.1 transglycosylase SLT domain-containing protein [Thermus sp.]MCS7218231.1 transglycosylase SLT domain-containing protein [Thermus sp.]MDW8017056.1 transglycosylase SLT domain-containing protein [Thermus sp.]